MESYLPLILQLVAGLIGGNAVGAAMKEKSLGPIGNSIAGLVGGGVIGQILQAFISGSAGAVGTSAGLDLQGIITSLVGGGAGGAILTAIVGVIKNKFTRAS